MGCFAELDLGLGTGFAGLISLILIILNILLSFKAGRNYARLSHDAALLKKRIGRGLTGYAYIPFYLMLLFIIFINIAYMLFVKAFTTMLKVFLNTFFGLALDPYTQIIIAFIVILLSYYYYHNKYKYVDKPLTRQARLILKTIEGPRSRLEELRKKYSPI